MERSDGRAGTDLLDFAHVALSWWLDELRAVVPTALKAKASGRKATIDCVLLPDGRVAAALARAGRLPKPEMGLEPGPALADHLLQLAPLSRRRTVRLSLPREICLLRRSRLPLRALSHAGAILRHEAEALLPLAPEEILTDWYVETEDRERREVLLVQAVLARPRIAEAQDAIGKAGLRLVSVTVGDAEGRPVPVDLLTKGEPSLLGALQALSQSVKLLLGGALALLLLAPQIAQYRQAAALDALAQARASSPRPSAAGLSAGAVADFLDAGAQRVPAAVLLDEVARRLPRDATLTQIDLDDDRLTLGLEGEGAERARAAFAASSLMTPERGSEGSPGVLVLRLDRAPSRNIAP